MPTEVLTQLRALRESIADALRKDPRYLTLTALDKTIAEIAGVLKHAGVAAVSGASEPLHFDPPLGGVDAAAFQAETPKGPSRETRTNAVTPGAASAAPVEQVGAGEMAAPATHEREHAADEPKEDELEPQSAPVAQSDDTAEVQTPAPVFAVPADPHEAGAPEAIESDVVWPDDTTTADDPASESLTAQDSGEGRAEPHAEAPAEPAAPVPLAAIDPTQASEPMESTSDHVMAAEEVETEAFDAHEALDSEALDNEAAQDAAFERAASAVEPSGYIPMQAKTGAALYQPAMSVKFGKLPNRVDLRPLMSPVDHEAATHLGVAQALGSAYEYWIRKASKQDHPVSRTFLHYNARWRAGSADAAPDQGCTIQFALEGLMRFGACGTATWPEERDLLFARPGGEAYRDAAAFKIHDMALVQLRLDAWKQALAEGKPIVFGCATFQGFDTCAARGGVVPMPSPETVARETPRLRPLLAVGYSQSERMFIVRTSEGDAFGDRGHCYMPFDYLMSDVLNGGDCWVFIPKVPSQPPREVWSDETSPVTNGGAGVSFAIETHEPAAYEALGRDLFGDMRLPYQADVPEEFAHYVGLAGRGAWDEMQANDADLLLAAATLEGGMAALASAFPTGARAASDPADDALGLDGQDDFVARRQQA